MKPKSKRLTIEQKNKIANLFNLLGISENIDFLTEYNKIISGEK